MSETRPFRLPSAAQEDDEEALSHLWALAEEGVREISLVREELARVAQAGVLDSLEARGLARVEWGLVSLTPEGTARAQDVVRRLRLAERLLVDVLTLEADKIEEDACRMEHVLSKGTADAICTLLGHPRLCPHGSEIPRGACCEAARERVSALLKPLEALREGQEGRVAYLLAPGSPDAQRLLSMGLVPGGRVRLEQRRPAFVVQTGENTVAMEPAVAAGIIVRLGGKL